MPIGSASGGEKRWAVRRGLSGCSVFSLFPIRNSSRRAGMGLSAGLPTAAACPKSFCAENRNRGRLTLLTVGMSDIGFRFSEDNRMRMSVGLSRCAESRSAPRSRGSLLRPERSRRQSRGGVWSSGESSKVSAPARTALASQHLGHTDPWLDYQRVVVFNATRRGV